jgi:hypothetical protein
MYVPRTGGVQEDGTVMMIPRRFESCTVSFDHSWIGVTDDYPNIRRVLVTRTTVPLGEVIDMAVKIAVLRTVLSVYPLGWSVSFTTKSQSVLTESWDVYLSPGEIDDIAKDTVKRESLSYASIDFTDESVAKRVAAAFKHAAGPLPGKEPF